jgi:malate dehydrogenase
VVALLKTGSAFFSPAAAAIRMAESIFHDQRQLLPVAAQLNGEYGLSGIYLGVPAIIGANGIEKVLEIELSESERGLLHESAERVKGLIALLGV